MNQLAIDESILRNGGYLSDPWQVIQLDGPGLEEVRVLHESGKDDLAAVYLLEYYRRSPHLYPGGGPEEPTFVETMRSIPSFQAAIEADLCEADETSRNIFWVGFTRANPDHCKQWKSVDEIDWGYAPHGTMLEWTYNLNRHQYWLQQARAWCLTGDERYVQAFCQQAEAWLRHCPRPQDYSRATHTPVGESWRTIEVGIRCKTWVMALSLFRHARTMRPLTWLRLLASLAEQAEFLEGFNPPYGRMGNWGIIQTQGLLHVALMFPELKGAARWREIGLKRMQDMAQVQWHEDGYHWESTPGYHHVVVQCYLQVYGLCKHARLQKPEFLPALHKAIQAQIATTQPDKHRVMLSDTDSQNTDDRDDMTLAAFLLEDPEIKYFAHEHLDYQTFWLWGLAAMRRYQALSPVINPALTPSTYLPQGGFAVMRSDWSEKARFLLLVMSSVNSVHRHDDVGHIELHAYGRHFLSDTSFYTYVVDDPRRRLFKEAQAHNTFVVDDISPSLYLDPPRNWIASRPIDPFWRVHTDYEYAQISQAGYLRLPHAVLPTRRVFYLKADEVVPDYWLVLDHADASVETTHVYQQRFHFAVGIENVTTNQEQRCIAACHNGAPGLFLHAIDVGAQVSLEDGEASPVAYCLERVQVGTFTYQKSGPCIAPLLLWPVPADQPAILPQITVVEATTQDPVPLPHTVTYVLAIDFGEGCRDLLLFNLCGAAPAVVEDTIFFGEVGLLRQRPGREPRWLRVK